MPRMQDLVKQAIDEGPIRAVDPRAVVSNIIGVSASRRGPTSGTAPASPAHSKGSRWTAWSRSSTACSLPR